MRSRAKFLSHISTFLVTATLITCFYSSLNGCQLDINKVIAEAERATQALQEKTGENQNAFDMTTITAVGRLADAFLITKQTQKAEQLLLHHFDKAQAHRLASTSAVRYGAPIPQIPSELGPDQTYLWRLECLISLTNGYRFTDSIKLIDQFSKERQTPSFRLRMMKIIANKCIEAKDKKMCRHVASLMWNTVNRLKTDETYSKLIYSMDLVRLARELESKGTLKKILESTNSLFAEPIEVPDLEADHRVRLLRMLGIANAEAGNFEQAIQFLGRSRNDMSKIDSDYFDYEAELANLELDFAEVYRLKGDNEKSFLFTKAASEATSKSKSNPATSIAKSIDGGSGIISTMLKMGQGSETKKVILAQIRVGKLDEADRSWQAMPICIQKLVCQIEAADYFLTTDDKNSAMKCAERCLKLIDSQTDIEEQIAFTVSAMTIFNKCKATAKRDRLLMKLLSKEDFKENGLAKKSLASELVELGMLDQAYKLIQSIENDHQRADPLSRLALALAKKENGF